MLELNGQAVLNGVLLKPLTGAWTAEVAVDERDQPSGAVTLKYGSREWKGYVYRAGTHRDTMLVRVVGGAGGLNTVIPAKHYNSGAKVEIILRDILNACEESLSSESSQSVLSAEVPTWSRTEGPAGEAIRALARKTGANWRVLDDGRIWFGSESWRESGLSPDVLEADPQAGVVRLWEEDPSLSPGSTLDGRHVTKTEYRFDEKVRTTAWLEDTGTAGDDIFEAIQKIVRHLTSEFDYFAVRPAKVVKQNSDGTLEIQPDDARFPGMSKVKVRYGLGGASTKISANARVLLVFENGDPSKPAVIAWESADVDTNTVPGSTVKLGSDTADKALALAEKVNNELSSIMNYLSGTLIPHTHAGVTIGTGVSGVSASLAPSPTHSDVGSTVVKASG